MELFERILSSPRDYPLPPLRIKEVYHTFYVGRRKKKDSEDKMVQLYQSVKYSLDEETRKKQYIRLPALGKPRFRIVTVPLVSNALLGLYEKAKEKQKKKELKRKRRFNSQGNKPKSECSKHDVVEIVHLAEERPLSRSVVQPLVRFRRAVKTVQVLLKATLSNNTQGQRNESKLLSWAHDDISSSKREYEMFGLSFDPGDFRAKKEVQLSNEAKAILSMDPCERNEEQLKVALLALNQAVESFSEFPITMQRSLVRVGWYEHFEDKRVIIRQGHMADNFYFILSGTAIVTILQTDIESGEEIARTAAVLKKGNSFGELALMHGAKRSATVTCKNSVELLAVGREDFVDIFMPMDKDQEPEHIRFLRTLNLLRGWPLQRLPYHDPKICCFTYFRRGLLLCKDSNASDWIYIIKTGTCRVLKALHAAKPNVPGLAVNQKRARDLLKLPPISNEKTSSSVSSLSPISSAENSPRSNGSIRPSKRRCTTDTLASILHKPYPDDQSIREYHQRQIDQIFNQKHTNNSKWGKRLSTKTPQPPAESATKRHKPDTVYVQIQKLGPRETYGVEQVAFGRIGRTTSTILVSEGAECILINKKYFQQYLTDEEAKRIRRTLQPIPSDESLQQKLQDMTNWEAYKAITVVNQMLYQKRLYNSDSLYY